MYVQKAVALFFLFGSLTLTREKKGLRGIRHLLKIALLRGEGFDLKSFGGEVVEDKKMLFHTFFKVLMVGL